MNIVCFGYRKWALKIFNALRDIEDVNLAVFSSRDYVDTDILDVLTPELVLFYGWSWIVPKDIVDSFLSLCLHPSALPKYRGGTPIQNQIMQGEQTSAVTIFKMTEGIDNGPICFQQPILLHGNIEDIYDRIFKTGLTGTIEIIKKHKKGQLEFTPQDHNQATVCKRRKPSESEITIKEIQSKPAGYIYDKIRMLTDPYPNAYITCGDNRKVYLTQAHLQKEGA